MNHLLPYHIFPLGDSALTLDFGNTIDESINEGIITRFRQIQSDPLPGMIEAVPAYSSLTIYYDVCSLYKKVPAGLSIFEWLKTQLEMRMGQPVPAELTRGREITIPVCYEQEYGPDLRALALAKEITEEEVIRIHTTGQYRVYMLGFLPGFAYMGEVDEKIRIARKPQPQPVAAGGIGIAGKQTGIYPLASPGGWYIIGRTALKLFNAESSEPALLRAGDIVQFYSITKNDFTEIQNSPLHEMVMGLVRKESPGGDEE